ncbi:hypothetical protein BO83DRAFT_88185 [Aspergillus eucalypticola CBS 122712]|uniref:Uncharacterized protein n=1 Tax=Aspergillus eucalypticola (strain CBS 122712 / IBT 29274) TaxID=1448314 RepID=A0A317V5P6_ASPEC|nr:uncharacterized protein BO83DRAFT_88185 [Aspergillus eucalypticola CBS 122712]PWY68202.1 hypothetical protein BO83DRAFT_88185 [Aspergillus eucalypticola CBS 122712]
MKPFMVMSSKTCPACTCIPGQGRGMAGPVNPRRHRIRILGDWVQFREWKALRMVQDNISSLTNYVVGTDVLLFLLPLTFLLSAWPRSTRRRRFNVDITPFRRAGKSALSHCDARCGI